MKRAIVVDSTNTLDRELLKNEDVYVVQCTITIKDKRINDNDVEDFKELENLMDTKNDFTRLNTEDPTPLDYVHMYEELAKKGYKEAIVLTPSTLLSQSHMNSVLGERFLTKKIKLAFFDTKYITTGYSLVCSKAIELSKSTEDIEDLLSKLDEIVSKVRMYIGVVETRFVFRSNMVNKHDKLLQQYDMDYSQPKYNFEVVDGFLIAKHKTRTHERQYTLIGHLIDESLKNKSEVWVDHGACEDVVKLAMKFAKDGTKKAKFVEHGQYSAMTFCLFGPNSCSLAYLADKERDVENQHKTIIE